MSFYSTAEATANHQIVVGPGKPVSLQIAQQLPGLNPGKGDMLVLHPKPEVAAAAVAYIHGFTASGFPTISLRVGEQEFGTLDLFEYRQNTCRPLRTELLSVEDNIRESSVIVINPTGRDIVSPQSDDLAKLVGTQDFVVVQFAMGQAGKDYTWEQAPSEVLKRLEAALAAKGVGKSIASRRVVCLTLGLAPLNSILVTALHALCESWPEQPVADKVDGVFRFVELVSLQAAEDLGRAVVAEGAPIRLRAPIATGIATMLDQYVGMLARMHGGFVNSGTGSGMDDDAIRRLIDEGQFYLHTLAAARGFVSSEQSEAAGAVLVPHEKLNAMLKVIDSVQSMDGFDFVGALQNVGAQLRKILGLD